MVGKKIVSDEQREILLNYFVANPSLWNCAPSSTFSKTRSQNWTELANLTNAASTGCQKTPRQWREYWNGLKYSARSKASQIARAQETSGDRFGKPIRITLTDIERRLLAAMPPQQITYSASDIDTRSSDSSQSSVTPLRVTSSSSVFLPREHPKILKTTFLPPHKYPSSFKSDLPANTQAPPTDTYSPGFKPDLPTKPQSSPPDTYSPGFKPDLPTKTQSPPPDTYSISFKPDLPTKTQSPPPDTYSPGFKPDLPAKTQSLPPDVYAPAFKFEVNILPLQVAIVTENLSRISFEEIDFIQKNLQQKIWEFMANPTTRCQPEFESCSKLEPFGLVFKCCNEDALEWLTTAVEGSPFKERHLIVFLDTPGKLPTTVDMCVELSSDFEMNKETTSVFNVLQRTNKSWLDTDKWTLLEDQCMSRTSDLAYPAKLSLVFSVPLSDIPKLRERAFKLHFLFGVVPVDYYQEVKQEVLDSRMVLIKQECLK